MDVIALSYRTFRQIETILPNFFCELLIRALLLLILILLHLKYQPQAIYITDAEMLNEYRRPRRESYVSPGAMILSIIFVPLIILSLPAILERLDTETIQTLFGWSLALLLNAILTEILKLTVCRPRPDFFYRCFPNGAVSMELYCTGNVQDIIEGRKSFPSGHSSFAFCSLGFLSLWLKGKLYVSRNRNLGIGIFCLTPLVLALAIGASRLCDNHHHWEDVLAGGIIGMFISYVSYTMYCTPADRYYHRPSHEPSEVFDRCIRDPDKDREKNDIGTNKKSLFISD